MNLIQRVQPIISSEIIESGLINAGFTLISSITKLRAGFNIEGLALKVCALKFKMQFFVKSDDFENKPTSIITNHDDIVYRIFLNNAVTCFHCKREGHISNQCLNLRTTTAKTFITQPKKI